MEPFSPCPRAGMHHASAKLNATKTIMLRSLRFMLISMEKSGDSEFRRSMRSPRRDRRQQREFPVSACNLKQGGWLKELVIHAIRYFSVGTELFTVCAGPVR